MTRILLTGAGGMLGHDLFSVLSGRDESFVDYVQDRKGHDRRYCVSIEKISSELGYAPQVPFDQGLAAVVQWYRDHREWWEPLKARAAL